MTWIDQGLLRVQYRVICALMTVQRSFAPKRAENALDEEKEALIALAILEIPIQGTPIYSDGVRDPPKAIQPHQPQA